MKSLKTILLVEDDRDDQELFIDALTDIKDTILFDVVHNGRQAIERLQRALTLPSVIFMDINMPVMNGIECLSEIAKDPAINGVPVIMLSSSVAHREQVRGLGAVAFIEKTSSLETFRNALRQTLQVAG
ncbi:response regulator [Chryseolinea lacunae]|uniref:Response regulator n=1 Tax=Chryseolinea lacunae TaxID=2801331 RepID=A0ABS1KTE4_9BACT|nr:response regulator [Chryseolinea lacunae]MBL0742691.1 response regulator [Chryseolinea lacunae]